MSDVRIGTAGWAIPRATAPSFSSEGSHLERYSRKFGAVEINSSFHRPHRFSTYRKWAEGTPESFRFSVKLPKAISHDCRLVDGSALLDMFAGETAGLGKKLAIVLVQLPPSSVFDPRVATDFFVALRQRMDVQVALEPRNSTWFTDEADACLANYSVSRVAAHPVLAVGGERPGGWPRLRYHRLHGSPRLYYSTYDEGFLLELAQSLDSETGSSVEQWCIFDNTASGNAAVNALALRKNLDQIALNKQN